MRTNWSNNALLLAAALLACGRIAPARAADSPAEPDPAGTKAAAVGLIHRVIPAEASCFSVEVIPSDEGRDVFEIESLGGKVVLRGNNGVSLASALDRYLEDYCGCEISWNCGNQLAVPSPVPPVPHRLRVVSPYRYRYAYNYCTHGYTMAWWRWPDWQHELDFLALKGVNLALVIEGEEQVWIDALGEFGYTDADVRKWLCLPAHQPWQYMSNMAAYGGPLSQELVDKRMALGRAIVARMRELGIEPVLQGYYGIVPSDFKSRFPEAKVHAQGGWNGLDRPDMLDPLDPRFGKLGAAFYRAQSRLYEGEPKFLSADPFHEGGSTEGIDLGVCGRAIYAAMSASNPEAVWVLQSWELNPRQPMLDALDKSKLLVLDLFCENKENWRLRGQFGNTPWLWCTIQNWGGNVGLGGDLDLLRVRPARALAEAGPGKGQMRGIGALMEGSQTQPMVWERFFGNAWRSDPPDPDPWLRDYARRRYGGVSPAALQALQIEMETVYAHPGYVESAVCARPSLEPFPKARFWGSTQPSYDPTRLVEAWKLMLEASDSCGGSDGYRYDLADLGRQVLADLAVRYHQAILQAYARKDSAAVAGLSGGMAGLFRDLDELLATRREFLLGVWLADARSYGSTEEESDRCERDARELLTTWTDKETDAEDYANRQWSGLVGSFYLQRWQTWFDALQLALATGKAIDTGATLNRIIAGDHAWNLRHDAYPSEPRGDTIEVSRRLLGKYGGRGLPGFATSQTDSPPPR